MAPSSFLSLRTEGSTRPKPWILSGSQSLCPRQQHAANQIIHYSLHLQCIVPVFPAQASDHVGVTSPMICATDAPCSVESPDIRSADQKDSRYPYMGPRRRPSLMPSELNTTLCRGHPAPARVVKTDTHRKTLTRIASPSGWAAVAMAFWSATSRIKAKPSSRREHFAFQP